MSRCKTSTPILYMIDRLDLGYRIIRFKFFLWFTGSQMKSLPGRKGNSQESGSMIYGSSNPQVSENFIYSAADCVDRGNSQPIVIPSIFGIFLQLQLVLGHLEWQTFNLQPYHCGRIHYQMGQCQKHFAPPQALLRLLKRIQSPRTRVHLEKNIL